MFDRDEERRLDLECLRLAADFRQIASDTLNPDLKSQCLRMAQMWSEQCADRAAEPVAARAVAVH
ncbi:MAG TPA: hypothetical protein VGC77_12900 [Rhodopseudomonas sp.]|uniref:hypothetical protein n=1 Tax=Rhodopseudomonas sp. TaxID=1078 RepID=UPI002ED8CC15